MKRLIFLLVVLLVLALGAFLVERPRIEESKRVAEGTRDAKKMFPALSGEDVTRITMRDGLTEKTMRKGASGWEVSGDGVNFWNSDQSKVDEVLKNIVEDLDEDMLATADKEKHKLFEVTPELGIEVEVYTAGEEPAAKFYVGKQGPDFISTYVRRDGDDSVYSIPIQLGTIYGRELVGWRDKRVMAFEPENIVEALFSFPEGTYRVSKDAGGTWMLLEPETAKANGVKIEAELKAFSQLEATSFESGTLEELGLAEPESEVRFIAADGKEVSLLLSGESEGYLNGYVEGNPEVIFKIAMSSISPLKITSISQIKLADDVEESVNGASEDSRETQAEIGEI